MGVALLPPPEKLKEKKKKEDKEKKEDRKHKEKEQGGSGSRGRAAAAADGAGPASPRGMGGSGTAAGRPGQGAAHGQGQAAAHGAADGAVAAVPGEPPKNRPGTVMLNQMRARGQRSEWQRVVGQGVDGGSSCCWRVRCRGACAGNCWRTCRLGVHGCCPAVDARGRHAPGLRESSISTS